MYTIDSKVIPVIKLKMILRNLPNDFSLSCSNSGDFIVYDGEDNLHGYIDLASEQLKTYEEAI